MTTVPIDKTRRKRLKVVSACGECRRKKTKCNGEKPCTGCIRAKVECKYVTSHKSRTFVRQPTMMMSSSSTTTNTSNTSPLSSPSSPSTSSTNNKSQPNSHQSHQQHAQYQQQQRQGQTVSVEAIEERLGVIEDILRALLKAQPSTLQLPVFGSSGTYHPRHAPHSQNWHPTSSSPPITPTPRRPTSAFHLPPLRQSSSTTSTSSSSSCTSIRNLLNDDDTLPTPPLTATFQKNHYQHQHHPSYQQQHQPYQTNAMQPQFTPGVYYTDELR
ncbi:hypothetical protein BDC45DRAFT_497001 [Circinella umbellata]|nr:hypothetical protein BDC45DRAFT_497001 [Circinella umbellata]